MKNNYIKLFERLSKQKPNKLMKISQFEDLGFFMTDFERLHKEKFVFLEKTKVSDKNNNCRINFYTKIAPRGFASLEEFNKNQKQEKINQELLRATIIIAVATALNVLIVLFMLILNLGKSNLIKPLALAVIGIAIAGLSGYLFKEIWGILFSRKNETTNKNKTT